MFLLQLLINGSVNAAIISLLAIGFGMVYRSMRFFYIAYGAIYIVAAYVIVLLPVNKISMTVSLPAALLASCAIGMLAEKAIYNPLRSKKATPEILFIASLGFYTLMANLMAASFGNDTQILSYQIYQSFSLGTIIITKLQMVQFTVGWILVFLFWLLIRNNSFFKGIWALGETPELIAALGFPVKKMYLTVAGLSSLFAGTASLLSSFDVGIDPHSGMQALLAGVVAVLVGGTGNYWGWIGGAVLLAFLQALAIWQFSSHWTDLVTFSILVATLIFRPYGLFSTRKRREEL